jgi:hypothetical protein
MESSLIFISAVLSINLLQYNDYEKLSLRKSLLLCGSAVGWVYIIGQLNGARSVNRRDGELHEFSAEETIIYNNCSALFLL